MRYPWSGTPDSMTMRLAPHLHVSSYSAVYWKGTVPYNGGHMLAKPNISGTVVDCRSREFFFDINGAGTGTRTQRRRLS